MERTAVYFFCMDETKDYVASGVFQAALALEPFEEAGWAVDGYPVLKAGTPTETRYYVRTAKMLCEDFKPYLDILESQFANAQLGVFVNWHGGQNAPDKVLCIHTVGDPVSGVFGPSNPELSTALARQMERHRKALALEDFKVTTEATHWSGVVYGGDVQQMGRCSVPFLDLEIGSSPESYNHPEALKVLALALKDIFQEVQLIPVILYCGGMHFEDTLTQAVLHPTHPVALTHVLPTRWLEGGIYEGEAGMTHLEACIGTIQEPLKAIVIHEKLKRELRDAIEQFGAEKSIPVFRRKALKNPGDTPAYQPQ